jgi:hypothetical protein
MKWTHPPIIKIYEALGSVADDRIVLSGNTAQVYSSSGNKYYDVSYDPEHTAIMSNDNASYWKGYLGYPAIAVLFKLGVLTYKPELADLLKEIAWKDINQQFKNDFDKTLVYIESHMSLEDKKALANYVHEIDQKIKELDLDLLGPKTTPPKGY